MFIFLLRQRPNNEIGTQIRRSPTKTLTGVLEFIIFDSRRPLLNSMIKKTSFSVGFALSHIHIYYTQTQIHSLTRSLTLNHSFCLTLFFSLYSILLTHTHAHIHSQMLRSLCLMWCWVFFFNVHILEII